MGLALDDPGRGAELLYRRRLKRDSSGGRITEEVECSPEDAGAPVRRRPWVWARTRDGRMPLPWERAKLAPAIEHKVSCAEDVSP